MNQRETDAGGKTQQHAVDRKGRSRSSFETDVICAGAIKEALLKDLERRRHSNMKTLALALVLLTIASDRFISAADSVALNDIAGDYYFGDGLGVNCSLSVTAEGKFTFQWDGCL